MLKYKMTVPHVQRKYLKKCILALFNIIANTLETMQAIRQLMSVRVCPQ